MFKQRFRYKNQQIDISILIMFFLMNIALFVVDCIMYFKGEHNYITTIIVLVLGAIFNGVFLVDFIVKLIKMLSFRRKLDKFKTKGKCFRAIIVDEKLGKPIFKSEVNTIYTYHPIVEFYDSTLQKEIKLVSKYPVCASYKKALRSNMITIYVIGDEFLITDFEETTDKEYSLERRTSKSRKNAEFNDKVEDIRQIVYAVAMLITAVLILGLKLFLRWLLNNAMLA